MTPLQSQLIAKWRHVLDATKHIYTRTGDGELCYWAEMASTRNNIIEIGTHFGRSAKMMLLANPDAMLWCIDGFYQDGTEHIARHFLGDQIADGRCALYKVGFPVTSDGRRLVFDTFGPHHKQIDMVLIDNGHEYEEVRQQLVLFPPLLKPGGLICGHDLDRNPDNGVTRAVKELIPDFEEIVPRVWSKIV